VVHTQHLGDNNVLLFAQYIHLNNSFSSPSTVLLRFLSKLSHFDWNGITDIAKSLLPQEEESQLFIFSN